MSSVSASPASVTYSSHARAPKLTYTALAIWVFGGLFALLAGCERSKPPAPAKTTTSTSGQKTSAAIPSATHSEELPEAPARIISLAPSMTELLFALGLGERVVAVTRFCDYPPRVKKLPRVGGFIDPDLEAVLAHRPDLILGTTAGDARLPQRLDKLGLSYAFWPMKTLAQTERAITEIGALLDRSTHAARLNATMQAGLAPVTSQGPKPRVLIVLGRKPIVSAGPGSLHHELLERAGGDNIVADSRNAYPRLDLEEILARDPEVIVDASMAEEAPSLARSFWEAYPDLAAVKRKQVHAFEEPILLRPGPRLVEAYATIKAIVAEGARAGATKPGADAGEE